MLDNFTGQELQLAAKSVKERWAAKGVNHFLIESSGGITYETCAGYFCPGKLEKKKVPLFFIHVAD
jgi:nicotinate-nucleotide pyrophosphorylase (carboxylating)